MREKHEDEHAIFFSVTSLIFYLASLSYLSVYLPLSLFFLFLFPLLLSALPLPLTSLAVLDAAEK
jgi:hypothetical protein